ncbi:hypothetical protein RBN93_001268 [Salmonella enterica]|uniref:hypothetical protein n=1 Tax=Salmonella enterica TaxID=28901 RepID=UPI000FBB1F2F|nr:hypothetical protein [Salmonella enterica]EBA0744772.1 hypothetical protein [Salmonella enterica subsp. enterica]EBC9934436.1 hypothetical protein [Salmonella enterica subsp. enterica serovar Nigeria]EBH8772588.1 hypothetical protein [Salmonella enterica subsp. enterica serovar Lagos]EBV3389070.1 hypothetical protein [Salmonella enterica subsp. enterica serovar Virchow]EBZ1060535.1 hypothetical protein [Salmonella enterica subsp. enterica serovar Ituri]EEL8285068.1 hypothetical protein [Sa
MSDKKVIFPFRINKIERLQYDAKSGELEVDVLMPHPTDGDIPWRLYFSPESTRELALILARTHKFLDEQLEGTPVTNVLQ